MNNMDIIIQKLYSNLVSIVVNGFENQDKEFIEKEYMEILKNRYSDLDSRLIDLDVSIENYDKLYNVLFKQEYNEWSNLSLDMKKHILLNDTALDEIINITNEAYKFAKEKLNKNIFISTDLANENISKLEKLYELVKEYNKKLAEWHISEGILDLKYSSGQTENMSMRLGHIK